jgi:hypothetical protein
MAIAATLLQQFDHRPGALSACQVIAPQSIIALMEALWRVTVRDCRLGKKQKRGKYK